jgi:hypothetical protein
MTINIFELTGSFAENKDIARDIRLHTINPELQRGEEVILDFADVQSMTQSFCHALISEVIRQFGIDVLDRISFAHCKSEVKGIIEIVVGYMQ